MGLLISLFTGPFGSIITKVLIGAFVLAALAGLYAFIVHDASERQKAEDQAAVYRQVIKNQEDFIKKSNAIIEASQAATDALNQATSKINADSEKINADLSRPEVTKDDRPASNVLKRTLKDLGAQ